MTPGLTDDTPARPILPGRQPKLELGIFAGAGGMAVVPSGGGAGRGPVEVCAAMKAHGFGWVVFNAFDGNTKPTDWAVWKSSASAARIPWGWWARCYGQDDLEYLAGLAQSDHRPLCVFNVEDELAGGVVTVEALLGVARPLQAQGCAVGVSTVSPVYQSIRWGKLTRAGVVVLPQAFMNYEPTTTAQGAYDQAQAQGATLVNCTLGVNKTARCPDGLTVADYEPLPSAWSVYPVEQMRL